MPTASKSGSATKSGAATQPARKTPAWPHFTQRYGKTVRDAGVTLVPRVLLTGAAELKLKPIHVLVLLQLIACWGKSGPHPFPKRKRLCEWIGCDKRTLDRTIAELVKKELIVKHRRTGGSRRQTSNEYDLSGLIERLQPLGRKAVNDRIRREKFQAAARGD